MSHANVTRLETETETETDCVTTPFLASCSYPQAVESHANHRSHDDP